MIEAVVAFEVVADGLAMPEGPVACSDGSVFLVEGGRQRIIRVTPDGRTETVAETGGSPNGLAVGPDGALYCCNNGGFDPYRRVGVVPLPPRDYTGGAIQRVDPATGDVEVVVREHGGRPLAGPNDLVFAADGSYWFTDFGKWTEDGVRHGGLYHARIDDPEPRRVAFGIGLNGVGLSPDGATVYAAATFERWLLAFPAALTGTEQRGEVVASFPGRQLLDSLAVEADGTVAVGSIHERPGISRVDPATGEVRLVPTPDTKPTNLCFGGADLRTAYVTFAQTGALVRCRWPDPGLPLPFNL